MPVRGCLLAHSTALWFLVLNVTVPIASGAREDAAMSALGYQPGQLLFGQFRILEYLGSAPLKHASPLPPRRRLPGDEGHQRADEGATGAAGEHGRPLRANATAAIIKEHVRLAGAAAALIEEQARPAAEAAGPKLTGFDEKKYQYLGTGTFGECYMAMTKQGKVVTIKFLYFVDKKEKAHPITPQDLRDKTLLEPNGDSVASSVADSFRECRLLQRLHENAAKSENGKYSAGIMNCYSITSPKPSPEEENALLEDKGDRLEQWLQDQPLEEGTKHKPIYMMLSYCGKYTLRDMMKGSNIFDDLKKVKYAIVKLAGPLQLLNEFYIVHRDLKPANVMFIQDNKAAGGFRLIIVDFGVAKQLSEEDWISSKLDVAGSPAYMPPEYLMRSTHQLELLMEIPELKMDENAVIAYYKKDIKEQIDEYKEKPKWFAQGIDVFALATVTFEMLTGYRLMDLYCHNGKLFFGDAGSKFQKPAAFNFFYLDDIQDKIVPKLSELVPWKTAMRQATFSQKVDIKRDLPGGFLQSVLLQAVHRLPDVREVTPADFLDNAWLKECSGST